MANKKITQLVNKTTILSTDLFPIGDATTGQLYKKTVAELQAAIGGAVISVNAKVGTVVLTTDDVLETVSPANQYFTTTRSRASVSATTPLAYNSSTGVFSIPVATTSANGYLSSTDWTTFNGKENVLTFSGPLVRTTNTISIPVATTSVNGYLSSTDWTTFNNKQGALTLTVTGSSGASTLVGTTLNIPTYTLAGLGGITATFLSAGAGITYSSSTGIIASTITQYTDALARAAHSFTAGSGAYNSTTGVITIPTNTSQLTNGAAFITLTSLSGSTGISYNSTTGAISSTITQYTDALARGAISLTTTGTSGASTYNSTTGVLNIPNYGSALSGYLPLTGGTLTGNLNGTSATFTSNVTIRPATGYNAYFQNSGTTLRINYLNDALSSNISASYRATDYVFQDGSGSAILTLASTGAATFSSSVTATSGTFVTSGTKSTVSIGNTATSTYSQLLMYGGATKYNWSLGAQYNTNNAFEITPSTVTEGTTFSTSVVTILQSGNVGIGTTSPALKLDVISSSQYDGIRVYNTTAAQGADIRVGNDTNNNLGYLRVGGSTSGGNNQNTFMLGTGGGYTIHIAPNSTPSMTFLNGGNVGIGTTSPAEKLSINGNLLFDVPISSTTYSEIRARYQGSDNCQSAIRFYNPQNGYSGDMRFYTQPNSNLAALVERMRISDAGLVAIGTTNTGYGNLGVYAATNTLIGIANSTSYAQLQQNGADLYINTNLSGATGGNLIFRFGSTSAEFMRIVSTGNILLGTTTDNGERLYVSGAIRATGTITANSDIRLKKNLERIENALEKVGQISGYTYNTIYDDKRHGGVIAQEIDEVFPEIVNKGNDGLLGVEYGNISALLIEALKELKEKNTALEARLQALEK